MRTQHSNSNSRDHLPRLTVSQREAARLLGLCVDTVVSMAERGDLERVRLSACKYGITMRSLEKLIGGAA